MDIIKTARKLIRILIAMICFKCIYFSLAECSGSKCVIYYLKFERAFIVKTKLR